MSGSDSIALPQDTPMISTIQPDSTGRNKNVVVILAGGKSSRNLQNIPNQFITVLGKPVIVYCMQSYQRHPTIDDIYIVCLKGWESIASEIYGVRAIPEMILISPKGEIVAIGLHGDELETTIAEVFADK
jgi:bifunctional N-acetylglucosamine-1-phosphate-uridyltransferase/glucosamine-1-phosphate-acetyltransferase GlmU-like protein